MQHSSKEKFLNYFNLDENKKEKRKTQLFVDDFDSYDQRYILVKKHLQMEESFSNSIVPECVRIFTLFSCTMYFHSLIKINIYD